MRAPPRAGGAPVVCARRQHSGVPAARWPPGPWRGGRLVGAARPGAGTAGPGRRILCSPPAGRQPGHAGRPAHPWRTCDLAIAVRPGAALVRRAGRPARRQLGPGRRRRAQRTPPHRPGPEPGPGRCAGPGPGAGPARNLAQHRRPALAAALRTPAQNRPAAHGPDHRRLAAPVLPAQPPWQLLRNWGMLGFDRSGPLKEWMAHQAMGTR